ncbi:hypothetical protein G9H71_19765, partial [Motilibacter sp. E257]|nr:hypothetical protein [Motilibacter deserti]
MTVGTLSPRPAFSLLPGFDRALAAAAPVTSGRVTGVVGLDLTVAGID